MYIARVWFAIKQRNMCFMSFICMIIIIILWKVVGGRWNLYPDENVIIFVYFAHYYFIICSLI